MNIKDLNFFQRFGTFFAVGYYDARESGKSNPSTKYNHNQHEAYCLGFQHGTKDKMVLSFEQKLSV